MVAWVVIDRQHFRQTSPSFFPCSNSHFGTHPALIPEEIIPFFSCTYVEPILQPLCFHIHTCNGGVPPPQAANLPTCFRVIPFLSTFLRTLLHIEKSYPYSYQKLPHSLRKTPGGRGEGACVKRKQTGGGGVPRRGGHFRRNSSTADSWNGQLFSVEKFFSNASSTAFSTARPRRMFPLRSIRKTSPKPGGSFSCAFAAPATASATTSANFFSISGSIAPAILVKIKRLRMP